MSEYNRAVLGKQAAALGFIRDTFEKVSRLASLLSFCERDPVLSRYLALKGGTAINLTIHELPRLSVDIDFDFAENLVMEEMQEIRKTIRETFRRHAAMNDYSLSDKSRVFHSLDSDYFQYVNSAGVRDNIKSKSIIHSEAISCHCRIVQSRLLAYFLLRRCYHLTLLKYSHPRL